MTTMKKGTDDIAVISKTEVQAALEMILANDMFIKAPRMCRLLRFLVEKAVSGAVRDTSEYAIGIEVFDRNPSSYSASEDPIVRVQVGRLRTKLNAYYGTSGACPDIEISIPIGSYMPVIRRMGSSVTNADFKQFGMLAIHPFRCISQHGDGMPFTQGLNEELMHQLFKAFGKTIVLHSFFSHNDNESQTLKDVFSIGVKHVLEGSVQIDAERIRTSIRLVDISVGCIAWSEQFDRNAFFAITLQEEIALSICGALKQFFITSNGVFAGTVFQVP